MENTLIANGANEASIVPAIPKRNRRKISSRTDYGSPQSSFVTVKLYGKLAEWWIAERGTLSDAAFIEGLLHMRDRYKMLQQKCKCLPPTGLEYDDLERENEISEKNSGVDRFGAVESVPETCETNEEEYKGIVNIEVEDESLTGYISEEEKAKKAKISRERCLNGAGSYKRNCEICGQVIQRGVKKKIHILSEHFTLFVVCKLCKSDDDGDEKGKLIQLDEYYRHMTSDHDYGIVHCPFCKRPQYKLRDSDSCSDHLLNKHWISLLCQCVVCNANKSVDATNGGVIKTISLKGHIALKHSIEKQKKVPCERCGQLLTPNSLPKHMKNMHEEKRLDENNLCDICGKYFVHLKQHKLSVHKGRDSRTYKCKTCGKPFAKKYNLEVHSRLHTGEKPFVCEVCGKGFCQNVELKIHTKNNHGTTRKQRRKEGKERKNDLSCPVATTTQKHESFFVDNVSFTQRESDAPIAARIISTNEKSSPDEVIIPEPTVSVTNQLLSAADNPNETVYVLTYHQTGENILLTSESGSFLQNLPVIHIDDKGTTQQGTISHSNETQGDWTASGDPQS